MLPRQQPQSMPKALNFIRCHFIVIDNEYILLREKSKILKHLLLDMKYLCSAHFRLWQIEVIFKVRRPNTPPAPCRDPKLTSGR